MSGAEREKDLLKDSAAVPAGAEVVVVPTTQASAKAKSTKESLQRKLADLTVVFRKDTRKPLLLGVFLMTMQQLSGIDGVIYVSTSFPLPSSKRLLPSHETDWTSTHLFFSNKPVWTLQKPPSSLPASRPSAFSPSPSWPSSSSTAGVVGHPPSTAALSYSPAWPSWERSTHRKACTAAPVPADGS